MAIGADELSERSSATNQSTQVIAATFLERIPQLLDGLRNLGFAVGVEHHLAVRKLLIGLAARKAFPLKDPTVFGRLICPLIAKSPLQQELFGSYFEKWIGQLPKAQPEKEREFHLWLPEKETQANVVKPPIDPILPLRRHQFLERWIVLVLVLAAIFIAVWWSYRVLYPKLVGAGGQHVEKIITSPTPSTAKAPGTPTEPQSDRTAVDRLILKWLIWIAVGGFPLLLALLILIRRRRNAYLQRKLTSELPTISSLHLRFPNPVLFKSNLIAKTSYDLRRSRWVKQDRLDPEATVQATVRAGGFVTPVSYRHRVVPEYLVLIDRRCFADQSTTLTESLLGRLVEDGLDLTTYYFDRSARFCFPKTVRTVGGAQSVSLDELVNRYPESRLLVFADLVSILQPGLGGIQEWIRKLALWETPALFVRRSDETASLIHDVVRTLGFSIFPASEDGLKSYADFINDRKREQIEPEVPILHKYQGLPDFLEAESVWLSRQEPYSIRHDSMFSRLRSEMGSAGFFCLAACAVYPEIRWKLTSYLVREICSAENFEESAEDLLGRLAVLPWFRYARMPDWLRIRLISCLRPKEQKIVRSLLENLLLTALAPKLDGQAVFQIAHENPRLRSRFLKMLLRRESITEASVGSFGYPLREHVFMGFMENKLSFRLPQAVKHLIRKARPVDLVRKFGRSLLDDPSVAPAFFVVLSLIGIVVLAFMAPHLQSPSGQGQATQFGEQDRFTELATPPNELGRTIVNVNTVAASGGVRGYEVWYVPQAFQNDREKYLRFGGLTPTSEVLVAGRYLMWAQKNGVQGPKLAVEVGQAGETEISVDLPAPSGTGK